MSGNIELALECATALSRAGVQEVCLCAGARNSPLIRVFTQLGAFHAFHFFEERSAAFFALGRIKATGRPVAVVTTSGTAAAELLPATIEGYYSGLPLLLVTADRPRRYRGTGAPQAIEQKGLFGPYAEPAFDIEADEGFSLKDWKRQAPAHLNLCFDEPLLDRAVPADFVLPSEGYEGSARSAGVEDGVSAGRKALAEFLAPLRRPWVIVGGVEAEAQEAVCRFLLQLGAPVYLEAQSGLRERAELVPLRVLSPESVKDRADGVLRLGSVPTLRFWRDLEEKYAHLPLLSVSSLPFSGAPRSGCVALPLVKLLAEPFGGLPAVEREYFAQVRTSDAEFEAGLSSLWREFPHSEPGLVHALSARMPAGARVYLGNSLPIREWDLAATLEPRRLNVAASRGANGIDGQISTFLGFAARGSENWGIFGDLTTLYDLSAPWVLAQLEGVRAQIVVINNGGGKIFSRIFGDAAFENRHALALEPWARLWGLDYERWESVPASLEAAAPRRVIELRPDALETAEFWKAYDRLCRRG